MKDARQLGSQRDPVRVLEGHEDNINSIATFPDGERIATGSEDKTIRIWKLKDGKEMKKWFVKKIVAALAIIRDGKSVVSAEGEHADDDFDRAEYWELWVRDAETGRVLAGPLDGHNKLVVALDVSYDGTIMASGSRDGTVMLWDTSTWQGKGDSLPCGAPVNCVKFSPTSQLGVATDKQIQVWDIHRVRLAQFNGHGDFNHAWNTSLAWTRDGAHLFSAGDINDFVIRSWNTNTWKQAGGPWSGHSQHISHIVLSPSSTLLASASDDHTVRLWQLSTGDEVARYQHSDWVLRVAFSVDGRFILSGGLDRKISKWEIPVHVLAETHSVSAMRELKIHSGLSRSKQNPPGYTLTGANPDIKSHFDIEAPGRGRNMTSGRTGTVSRLHATPIASESAAGGSSHSTSRVIAIRSVLNRVRPSPNAKGKQMQRTPNIESPEVAHVPLGQATYGDYVAGDENRIRPYSLFFCLSWCKKERVPGLPQQPYDIDLMNAEQVDDVLDIPVPKSRGGFSQPEDSKFTMDSLSQPEAGPSYLMENAKQKGELSPYRQVSKH